MYRNNSSSICPNTSFIPNPDIFCSDFEWPLSCNMSRDRALVCFVSYFCNFGPVFEQCLENQTNVDANLTRTIRHAFPIQILNLFGIRIPSLQWGSENQTCPDFKWLITRQLWNGIQNTGHNFFQNLDFLVQFRNGKLLNGFQHPQPSENRAKMVDHPKTDRRNVRFSKGRISGPHCIQILSLAYGGRAV